MKETTKALLSDMGQPYPSTGSSPQPETWLELGSRRLAHVDLTEKGQVGSEDDGDGGNPSVERQIDVSPAADQTCPVGNGHLGGETVRRAVSCGRVGGDRRRQGGSLRRGGRLLPGIEQDAQPCRADPDGGDQSTKPEDEDGSRPPVRPHRSVRIVVLADRFTPTESGNGAPRMWRIETETRATAPTRDGLSTDTRADALVSGVREASTA
jgi:hypothetical protein